MCVCVWLGERKCLGEARGLYLSLVLQVGRRCEASACVVRGRKCLGEVRGLYLSLLQVGLKHGTCVCG